MDEQCKPLGNLILEQDSFSEIVKIKNSQVSYSGGFVVGVIIQKSYLSTL